MPAGPPSASLNKTITEIMRHLKDRGPRPGGLGADLRLFLHEKIGDLAERWYQRGFNRGHIESNNAFRATGKVPRVLTYKGTRHLSPRTTRAVSLKSTLKSTSKLKFKKSKGLR
jgi:hypothetical protein